MRRVCGAENGLISFTTLVMLLLLSAVVLSLAAVAVSESKIAATRRNGVAAQYLAEAAAKHAVVRLSVDASFSGERLNDQFLLDNAGGSAAQTMVTPENGVYGRVIVATATAGGATRTVVLHVVLPHDGAAGPFTILSWNNAR